MAQSDLDLIADLKVGNERQFNQKLRRIEKRGVNLDTRRAEQSLGRVTGKADDFTRSLEASNARVIAFGASVAIIEGVRRSFVRLVSVVTELDQSLTAINSILGRTSQGIQQVGNEIVAIAKNTGQSLQGVSNTVQEFARQGLSVEQTLKRANDALVLTRLTTLNTDEAVAALTATLNGFEKQALSSEQVINKLRAVETSFAVASDDLANALARSASVAQDAGVTFEELLGVITAIKQRTGLGGATIGQGLKTVFTRLNLPTRIEQLRELGVNIDESVNGLEKLRQVSIAVKKAQDEGNVSLATQIGTIAAGQFQISKISAAFSDLASSYSVTDAAAQKATEATNEAIIANEQYNETIISLNNEVNRNIDGIIKKFGELGATDFIKDFLRNVNAILEAFQGNNVTTSSLFTNLLSDIIVAAKEFGFLADAAKGFINVLTGPGLVTAGAIIANLLKNTFTQSQGILSNLVGLNAANQRRAEVQGVINNLIKQSSAEQQKELQLATSQEAKERVILSIMQQQLATQRAMNAEGAAIAGTFLNRGLRTSGGEITRLPRSGRAKGDLSAIGKEQAAIRNGVGGASSSAQVRIVPQFNYGNGKIAPAVVNSDEAIIPSQKGDIVLNRDMMSGMKNFALGPSQALKIQARLSSGRTLTPKQLNDVQNNLPQIKSRFPNLYEEIISSTALSGQRARQAGGGSLGQSSTGAFIPVQSKNRSSGTISLNEAFTERNFQSQVERFQGGESVSGAVKREIIKRNIDAEIEKLKKETGDQSLTASSLKSRDKAKFREIAKIAAKPVVNQQRVIRETINEQALARARVEIEKETRGFRVFTQLGKAESRALKDPKLGKAGRDAIRQDISRIRGERGAKLGQGAFFASFALSALAPLISSSVEGPTGKALENALSFGASGLALGALLGPAGAAIGGIGGAALGAGTSLIGGRSSPAEEFEKNLSELDSKFKDTQNSIQSYIRLQAELDELYSSGAGDTARAEFVRFQQEGILESLPQGLAKNIRKASGEIEDINEAFAQFSLNFARERRGSVQDFSVRSLFNERTRRGTRTTLSDPEGVREDIKNILVPLVRESSKEFTSFEELRAAISSGYKEGQESGENLGGFRNVLNLLGADISSLPDVDSSGREILEGAFANIIKRDLESVFLKAEESRLGKKVFPTTFDRDRGELVRIGTPQGKTFDRDRGEFVSTQSSGGFQIPAGQTYDRDRNALVSTQTGKVITEFGTNQDEARGPNLNVPGPITPETLAQVQQPISREVLSEIQRRPDIDPNVSMTPEVFLEKIVEGLKRIREGDAKESAESFQSAQFQTESVFRFIVEGEIGGEQRVNNLEEVSEVIVEEVRKIRRKIEGKTPLPNKRNARN